MLVELLAEIGGIEEAVVTLSQALVAAGHSVCVYACKPVSPRNEYAARLRQAGVPVRSAPSWLYCLSRLNWKTRDRLITWLIRLFFPILALVVVGDSLVRRRALKRSWQGAAGRARRWVADRFVLDYLSYLPLRGHLAMWRPEVVHVHGWGLGVDPPCGIAWCLARGLPVVYTEHGVSDANPAWERLPAGALSAHACIGPSEGSVAALARWGVPQDRLWRIPYIVQPPMQEGNVSLETENMPDHRVVCIARLSVQKGHCYLLEGFAHLIQRHPSAHLYLVGDGPLRDELQRQVSALKLEEHVSFVGAVPHSCIDAWFMRATVVVLPSLWEGLPNTILEAMAYARPIVATDIPGTRDLIENGVNGRLVPPKEPVALVQAIGNLLSDPELCQKMGEAGRRKFLTGPYTSASVVAQTVAVYRAAIFNRAQG
jgi:glycosyltransferase involved in cell wall biosynthesis